MSDWTETEEARQLLAELDAAERASDLYCGWGWSEVARSFTERAQEIEGELDDLRRAAVNEIANASGFPFDTVAWSDSWDEADDEAESVEAACQRARRLHLGDGLIERAAAA